MMMNDKQIKIADYLLRYLESCNGQSIKDNYFQKLTQNGFDRFDITPVIRILVDDLKLIRSEEVSDYRLFLNQEGNKAVKIGLVKYLDEKDEDKQLDRAAKKASIKGVDTANKTSKISIFISVVALIASIVVPFLLDKQIVNSPTQINSKSQNSEETTNSQIPPKFTDTLFIEKIKYSLKHDTAFANDIKKMINKEITDR